MSRINGEKARANIQKRNRTLQRMKDRVSRAAQSAKPAASAKKSSKRGA